MLTVIIGPMSSGKSTRIITTIGNALKTPKKLQVFKPSNDNRYGHEFVVSHDGLRFPAVNLDINSPYQKCIEIINNQKIELAIFDEVQFYNIGDMLRLVKELLYSNREVICAGLPQDSFGEPFGPMPFLMSMADEVISLKANCAKCLTEKSASRTFRKVQTTDQVVIGGLDSYEPRCFTCWVSK